MEFILIHRSPRPLPPEIMKASFELGKKLNTKPEEVAPGCKLVASYHAKCQGLIFCIWDAPSLDSLMPPMEQLSLLGYDTEVIPADKMSDALPKFEKAMAEAMK